MRVCVVEVVESCGRHLDKLINVDEFLRRITTVMHSNDPVSYSFMFSVEKNLFILISNYYFTPCKCMLLYCMHPD